jgi:Family of unknown function (DUF6064)
MQLPFSHDQFLAVFADYNRNLWPVEVLAWLATVYALWRAARGASGGARLLAAALAFQWLWSGAVYHLIYFRPINPAAVLFGALFAVEGVLIGWRGVVHPPLRIRSARTVWSGIGVLLMAYAVAYPGIGLLLGLTVPAFPGFAVPCPTTILTAGALLQLSRKEARVLGIVPILWAAIGGSAAFLLGIKADFALPVSGVVLAAYLATPGAETAGDPPAASPTR